MLSPVVGQSKGFGGYLVIKARFCSWTFRFNVSDDFYLFVIFFASLMAPMALFVLLIFVKLSLIHI